MSAPDQPRRVKPSTTTSPIRVTMAISLKFGAGSAIGEFRRDLDSRTTGSELHGLLKTLHGAGHSFQKGFTLMTSW